MATLVVTSDSGDGMVERSSATTFADVRSGAGTTAYNGQSTDGIQVGYAQPSNKFINRGFLSFDTSALGSSATITAAVLTLNLSSNAAASKMYLCPSTHASTTTLVTGDYTAFTYTDLGNISLGVVSKALRDITLNSTGLTNISKTGTTKFALIGGDDWDNAYSHTYAFLADASETGSNIPTLTITYTLPNTSKMFFLF